MLCAQTLAFENRGAFADVCKGTVLRSYYSGMDNKDGNNSNLDLRYDDYVTPASITPYARGKNPVKAKGTSHFDTGQNICAYNDFSLRNLVQWLKDQDKEMYQDSGI